MSADLQRRARSESTILASVSRQLTKPKAIPQGIRLTDQVAIVTGSNVGLGLEASRQLLQLGLTHLVMGVRSETKGNAAANLLRKEFPMAQVSVWLLDMESYDSIRAFANRCASLPRIDISILNAGLTVKKFNAVPATGHETTVQVNYISTALLTILLLPILKSKKHASTRPPVLTLVGSDVTYTAKIDTKNASVLKQFDKADSYAQMPWYAAAKLFLAFFTTKLVGFVDPNDVLINVVSPGLTKGTGFFGDAPLILGTIFRILAFFLARSAELGATTYIDATIARGPESHGLFLSDWAVKPYPEIIYTAEGKEFRERLWEETMKELDFVGASRILGDLKNS
ncbi:NAD(P)-binding protein [Periconia macrospinosa]|uniref:NAD(P)-binding protein n=1 Tax=Periconia macrospinosa TaxID=97972 RepID=A0A2V1DH19_9PLEO|nr:NAD(P)-binding protein [Periconia macrospinosa]